MTAGRRTRRGATAPSLSRRGQSLEARRQTAVSRVGSPLTVFFRPTPPIDAAEAFACDRSAYARFFGAMLDLGILLPPSQFEAWFVSITHGQAEIEATLEAAGQAFLA